MKKTNYLITYFLGTGLNPTEACLLSKIQEIEKNIGKNINGCMLSNEFFADYLGVSKSTIKRSITRLKGLGLIKIETVKGSNNKKRKITTDQQRIERVLLENGVQNEPHIIESEVQNEPHIIESEVQNEPHIIESEVQNEPKWGSKRTQARLKMNLSGVQNDPIKLNNKINNKLNNKLKEKTTKTKTEEPETNSKDLEENNEELNEFDCEEILDLESYEDIEPVTEEPEANSNKAFNEFDYETLKEISERNKDNFTLKGF